MKNLSKMKKLNKIEHLWGWVGYVSFSVSALARGWKKAAKTLQPFNSSTLQPIETGKNRTKNRTNLPRNSLSTNHLQIWHGLDYRFNEL
ncbi:MAG: hypothetical protein L0Y58_06560 [Verrucomicrobia subdivision 3 bacterium]|nr:hypothetical protein [Limisphaerales bacterium]